MQVYLYRTESTSSAGIKDYLHNVIADMGCSEQLARLIHPLYPDSVVSNQSCSSSERVSVFLGPNPLGPLDLDQSK